LKSHRLWPAADFPAATSGFDALTAGGGRRKKTDRFSFPRPVGAANGKSFTTSFGQVGGRRMAKETSFFRPRKVVAGLVALVVVGGLAIFHFGGGSPKAPAHRGGPPVTVGRPVRRDVVNWQDFTGQFAAIQSVAVKARVSGYLTGISFTDGQMVKKGDLLFQIDPRPYQAALDAAEAKLEQAKSSKVYTALELRRAGRLRAKDYLSQSTLDQRQQQSVGALAAVEAARAAVATAKLNLEFTKVVAPISGRIGARDVTVGNLVTGGGNAPSPTLLTTIVSTDPVYINFDLSEADYLALRRRLGARAANLDAPGNTVPVEVQLADESGWPHKGRLDFIDNREDPGSGTIRARAILSNPDGLIVPGTFARVRLAVSPSHPALLIPDSAVVFDQSRKLVMTVAADGKVVPKPVVLGPRADGLREVVQGLAPTDRVIIDGLMRARPGATVTPVPGQIRANAHAG
jgi:RND family efflux transporter MFP subunit